MLVYGRSQSGSDWEELKVRKLDSGEDYPDTIRFTKFPSVAWNPDNSGFFYNRPARPCYGLRPTAPAITARFIITPWTPTSRKTR